MSIGVFDHPILSGLFADSEIVPLFDARRQVQAMVDFEIALTGAMGAAGMLDRDLADRASAALATFEPDLAKLAAATGRDGVPVPELVRQLKAHVGPDLANAVHQGATSQDLVDTALVKTLKACNRILERRIGELVAALDDLAGEQSSGALMGRTRMQAALPISASDRIRSWQAPLQRHLDRFAAVRRRLEVVQLGGAVGNRAAWGDRAPDIAGAVAASLDLQPTDGAWHSERDGLAAYGAWLSLVTGSLGKVGQDVTLMAQPEIAEIALRTGGGSSAMPHKQNPVQAELLVTLARYNAVQLAGLHQALVHEQERSGSAWTLEWMILPPMVAAAGVALSGGLSLLADIERIGIESRPDPGIE